MVLRKSARQGGMVLRKTGLRGPDQLRTNSRHARIVAKGAVTLRTAGHAQRGRISNVGQGGMFVPLRVPGSCA